MLIFGVDVPLIEIILAISLVTSIFHINQQDKQIEYLSAYHNNSIMAMYETVTNPNLKICGVRVDSNEWLVYDKNFETALPCISAESPQKIGRDE